MSFNKRGYKFYVVNVQTLSIDSGWENVADANDRATALKEETHAAVKVMSKPRIGFGATETRLDPNDDASWRPRRSAALANPGAAVFAPAVGSMWTLKRTPGRTVFKITRVDSKTVHVEDQDGYKESMALGAFRQAFKPASPARRASRGDTSVHNPGLVGGPCVEPETGSYWRKKATDRHNRVYEVVSCDGNTVVCKDVVTGDAFRSSLKTFVDVFEQDQSDRGPRANPKKRRPKRESLEPQPDGEPGAAEFDLSPEEHRAVSDLFLKYKNTEYGFKDFPNATANQFRLVLVFVKILDAQGMEGSANVRIVPGQHIGALGGEGVNVIYENIVSAAEELQMTGEMRPFEEKYGWYFDMINGWSSSLASMRATSHSGKALRLNPEPDSARAEEVYEMWHRRPAEGFDIKKTGVKITAPMVCIGRAHDVVYASNKWEKDKRKTNDYVHTFGQPKVWLLESFAKDVGGARKTVEHFLQKCCNAEGRVAGADLAKMVSLCVGDENHEIKIHSGARVFGGNDQKTVVILDPVYKMIVITGGKMFFDERGIVN